MYRRVVCTRCLGRNPIKEQVLDAGMGSPTAPTCMSQRSRLQRGGKWQLNISPCRLLSPHRHSHGKRMIREDGIEDGLFGGGTARSPHDDFTAGRAPIRARGLNSMSLSNGNGRPSLPVSSNRYLVFLERKIKDSTRENKGAGHLLSRNLGPVRLWRGVRAANTKSTPWAALCVIPKLCTALDKTTPRR